MCPKNALQSQENLNISMRCRAGSDVDVDACAPRKVKTSKTTPTPCGRIFLNCFTAGNMRRNSPGLLQQPSIKDKDVIEEIRRENFRVIE
ncbi:CIC_collapsed_G0027260.mRNA.1.CDS.1 [Saccharomyces cerevisiae]|nr:CIC_collapsed_G0027260.mRNA.1.CDS.1 [Saccharomyces cerevisiae]